jgi:hypothetical protein
MTKTRKDDKTKIKARPSRKKEGEKEKNRRARLIDRQDRQTGKTERQA